MNDEIIKRRFFQQIKSMTYKSFNNTMIAIHSAAYEAGFKHVVEAMEMDPKIYKPTIDRVINKANQIRKEWDEVNDAEVPQDELELIRLGLRGKAK